MSGFFDFLRTSFLHVLPILIAGGFAVAIILERTRALFKTYPIQNAEAFFERLTDLVMSGKLGEAINLCDKYPAKPAAKVAKQALLRAHQPENLIEHGIELAVGEASAAIGKRTTFLATIANVATLLGLFGTIAGLIHSFEAVGHADPQQKAALLAAGISSAMNATMMGLGVAIPCMVAFSFLINRTNQLIGDIDHTAVRTLDMLKQRYYAAEFEALNPRNNESRAGSIEERLDSDDSEDKAALKNGHAKKDATVVSLRRSAMSAGLSLPGGGSGGGRGRRGTAQDFELNLASIIDCFTVLIAFMLATASFLSIGILDAGVAAAGQTSTGAEPPPVNLTLELKPDHSMELKLQGKSNQAYKIPARAPAAAGSAGADTIEWDYATLTTRLGEIKGQWASLNAITLTADNTIEYKNVIKTMEVTRASMPVVLLGGF